MSLIIDNIQEYRDWLKQWMYADLPSFDLGIDNKSVEMISYTMLIPTAIILHTFVLSGLCVALISNVLLRPLGKRLNTILAFIT